MSQKQLTTLRSVTSIFFAACVVHWNHSFSICDQHTVGVNCKMLPRGNNRNKVWMAVMMTTALLTYFLNENTVSAWTVGTGPKRCTWSVQYAPTSMPTTETPELVAQKMLQRTLSSFGGSCGGGARPVGRSRSTSGNIAQHHKQQKQQNKQHSPSVSLSQLAMAACDATYSSRFPTSHGLLSPETVSRMEVLTMKGDGPKSEALVSFLKTYKKHGPMSCLPMLSDPDILPHLTNAMRESMSC